MLKSSCILILNLFMFVILTYISNKWEPFFLVTKIPRKIRATTFTEKLWKVTCEGDERLG